MIETASEATVQRLRGAGLRVTSSRLAVLEVIHNAATDQRHLSASQVATQVRDRLGAVSTQAIYDCLDALTGAGLLRRIEPAGHPARYESRVGDNHHHVVCRHCGAVADIDCYPAHAPCLLPPNNAGFEIDEAEITFWGKCPNCATAQPNERDK